MAPKITMVKGLMVCGLTNSHCKSKWLLAGFFFFNFLFHFSHLIPDTTAGTHILKRHVKNGWYLLLIVLNKIALKNRQKNTYDKLCNFTNNASELKLLKGLRHLFFREGGQLFQALGLYFDRPINNFHNCLIFQLLKVNWIYKFLFING